MIRPVLDEGTAGRGRWWLRDVRVPTGVAGEFHPSALGSYVRAEQCPDGRHTWDVIEALGPEKGIEDSPDPAPNGMSRQAFRLAFTCLMCGRVEYRRGEFHDEIRDPSTRVDPVPLKAGGLRAQMIDPGYRPLARDRDYSLWMVHDTTGAMVGLITPQVGRRGAVRHQGRLYAWPQEQDSVRGASPRAVLRALARAHATGDVQVTAPADTTAAGVPAVIDASKTTSTATTTRTTDSRNDGQGGAK